MIIEALIILFLFIIFFILPGFTLVRDDEVGIMTKKMLGDSLPQGQIIATKGEVGVQADILMPGLYWRIPVIWKIERARVTMIRSGFIGVVESIEGTPIPTGRLLGDEVESNSFQNAKAFLEHGGSKGPQVATLRPGTYRINTKVFRIKEEPATIVPIEKVGVATAQDGTPLPSGFNIAPEPVGDHKHFQDGQAFILHNGFRGPQLETLQPGEYYINPLLFEVAMSDVAVVPPGYVAVIISSVGKDLERPQPNAPLITTTPTLGHPLHETIETPLITSKSERGILREPVAPGKYNLNRIAYRAEFVPTSAITIDWAEKSMIRETRGYAPGVKQDVSDSVKVAEFFNYSQLKFTSKDGFQLEVEVRLIIRIPPANAPYAIARFGSVTNLIEQVAHPLIDSSFRNEAGDRAAMDFVHSRSTIQLAALEKVRTEFESYHVEVQGLLIAYIKVDEKLLETQTKKEIAVQQQQQYNEEAKAQERRIAVAEKTARADKQTDVIRAKLSIEIATDNAEAFRKEAEGIRDATKTKADGLAYEAQKIGEGTASAYKAQTDVIGSERVAAIKLIQEIANGKVVITPSVLVSGGEGNQSGNLVNAILATWLTSNSPQKKEDLK
ncbi:MAG: SPFH domain-containing protein [Methanoregula sp.]|nr:SPFH domain-containing protein [Methanoregula sp.]